MPLLALDPAILKNARNAQGDQRRALEAEAQLRAAAKKPAVIYFLHIPKCGGTTVAHLMRSGYPGAVLAPRLNAPADPTHCLLKHVADIYDISFSVVRHPLSWYESWWRYLKSPRVTRRDNTLGPDGKPDFDAWVGAGVWHPLRSIAPCHSDSFTTFMSNVIETEPGFVSRMYDEYLGFSSGAPRTGDILKIETIDFDYARFCEKYGLRKPAGAKHENQSVKSLTAAWTPDLREKAIELEQPALRFFNYQ